MRLPFPEKHSSADSAAAVVTAASPPATRATASPKPSVSAQAHERLAGRWPVPASWPPAGNAGRVVLAVAAGASPLGLTLSLERCDPSSAAPLGTGGTGRVPACHERESTCTVEAQTLADAAATAVARPSPGQEVALSPTVPARLRQSLSSIASPTDSDHESSVPLLRGTPVRDTQFLRMEGASAGEMLLLLAGLAAGRCCTGRAYACQRLPPAMDGFYQQKLRRSMRLVGQSCLMLEPPRKSLLQG